MNGLLPEQTIQLLRAAPNLGWYVHVPFCRTRCGYCDFNTYTSSELGGATSQRSWAAMAMAEVRFARAVLGDVDLPADTVFFGGGTPTLLPPADLASVIATIETEFGLAPDAEITVEANPDTVTEQLVDGLVAGGVNRISVGMQSADRQVLQVLDRTHNAEQIPRVVQMVRAGGIERVSLDLIYGTPGETQDQWRTTVQSALALAPDHLSAYCLGIEEGTKLGAAVRTGLLPPVDQDEAADRYLLAEELLTAAGLTWYEISNWASPGQQSRHNLRYWRSANWWGVGPGAHSHVAGVRWWNHRHPRRWEDSLRAGQSPALAREVLSTAQQQDEEVLLQLRLRSGVPVDKISSAVLADWVAEDFAVVSRGRVVLTLAGRLIADNLVLQALTA